MELTELRDKTKEQVPKKEVGLLDMLAVLLGENGNPALQRLLVQSGIDVDTLLRLTREFQAGGNPMPQSLLTKAICDKQGPPFCDIDLLNFIFSTGSDYLEYLNRHGFPTEDVTRAIHTLQETNTGAKAARRPILDSSLFNMSLAAREGRYDSLSGREEELQAVENILLRRDKANVILTGEAGVGKTAVAELLAKQSVQPAGRLTGYTFYSLDITTLLGAQPYRGELERRISALLSAVEKEASAVLFIDEIHRINQPPDGQGEGSQVADILKPYLTRGTLRIIGATTTAEYQKYFARHPALSRRFQQVKINELAGEPLFTAVRSYADALQTHHGVRIDDSGIAAAIALTDRYMPNRCQPDKSNELLDSACVAAVKDTSPCVREAYIQKMLSIAAHIPESIICRKMNASETAEQRIRQQLFGQNDQVARAVKTMLVKMAGFKEDRAPLTSMVFAGDSGVGKTRLAVLLAKEVLGDEKAITVIDMAEFSENHSVSKLVGSPPGYVGSDREGILTAAIAARPFSVILFDEIEKAAPEVHKILLGVLDSGKLRSGLGMEYDAGNIALIFTTNAVTSKQILKPVLGFSNAREHKTDPAAELAKSFPAEFIGRIDEIIMFNTLSDTDYRRILAFQFEKTRAWFESRKIRLVLDEPAAAARIMECFGRRSLGARGLLQAFRNLVTVPVMDAAMRCGGESGEIDVNKLLDRNLRTEAAQ